MKFTEDMATRLCGLLLILIVLLAIGVDKCHGQELIWYNGYIRSIDNVVTDSVVWRITKIENPGDTTCLHDWAYSEESDPSAGISCGVLHYGFHCDLHDLIRYRICRLCLRKEKQKEFWYQSEYIPPKSEYEKLDEKLRTK